ncbi:hypothetical protein CH378_12335 [Leptospira kmetyi]|uniref:Uncharacterized protein n=2 Tax=Leptospira kmetyi TaxID=408139 RepID=A0ABX4NBC1_9LEPT|nr:hypothetical protein CH378_12335 [Leptospira kmetyi]
MALENVCPDFGRLDRNANNADRILEETEGFAYNTIGIKTKDGSVIFVDQDYVFNALEISTEKSLATFKTIYSQVCAGPIPFEDKNAINAKNLERVKTIESFKNKDIRELISIISQIKDEAYLKELNLQKEIILDKKVKRYIQARFPFSKKYLEYDILFRDGEESNLKFFEIMRTGVLGKNPKTGFKILPVLLERENRLVYIFQNEQTGVSIYFREYNGKLIVDKVSERNNGIEKVINTSVDQRFASRIFNDGSEFPIDSYLDFELIDKTK